MKVFYICFEDLRIQAAWTTHIREVTENLIKLGHDVVLFAPDFGMFHFNTTAKVVSVPIWNTGFLREYIYYFSLAAYILYYHCKTKADILYVREMALSLVPFLFSKLLRIPHIIEINGLISADHTLQSLQSWKMRLFETFQKFNTRTATMVIVQTEGLKTKLMQLYSVAHNKIAIIENGANTTKFFPIKKEECRSKLNLLPNNYYLVFAGRFYDHHGIIEFLNIVPKVLQQNSCVKFILIGDGNVKLQAEKQVESLGIKDSVAFPGEIAHDLIPVYLNAADFCLMFVVGKNHNLLSPIKLFEYWACSLPVITNRGSNIAKLVKKLNAGLIIDLDNPEKSANAIVHLLNDKHARKEMGQNGRTFVLNHCTWKKNAQKIEKICKDIISR